MDTITLDTETTGPDFPNGCRPFMVTATISDEDTLSWEWDVDPMTREVSIPSADAEEIYELVWNNKVVFHNAPFDIQALGYAGIIDHLDFAKHGDYDDTMVMLSVLNSLGGKGLKDNSLKLGIPNVDEKELHESVKKARARGKSLKWRISKRGDPHFPGHKGSFPKFDYWLPRAVYLEEGEPDPWKDVCHRYGALDALRTWHLYWYLHNKMTSSDWDAYKFQMDTMPTILRMSHKGLGVSYKNANRAVKQLRKKRDQATRHASFIIGLEEEFNIDSYPQVSDLVYGKGGLGLTPEKYTDSGGPATGADELLELRDTLEEGDKAYKFLTELLIARKCNKAASNIESYMEHTGGTGVLHPQYSPVMTPVNRMSCRNPNTQAVRKRAWEFPEMEELGVTVRSVFRPGKGREWWTIDYDQLHLRLFAYLSGDPGLIELYESGGDMHDQIARINFDIPDSEEPTDDQRGIAKGINYGFIYGAQPKKIAAISGRNDLYPILRKKYPNAIKLLESMKKQAKNKGYIRTADGHPLRVPRKDAYKAINYFIQGTEGYLVKRAMILCDSYCQAIDYRIMVVSQVHDELIFDAWNGASHSDHFGEICDIMRSAGNEIGVVCEIEAKVTTTNWAAARAA